MTPRRIWTLAAALLVAKTGPLTVAPTHPVYNPPIFQFLLGAFALAAAIWAREAARWPSPVALRPGRYRLRRFLRQPGHLLGEPDLVVDLFSGGS